jgi:hypothetical protein
MSCARPHATEASVKPARPIVNRRLRPSRSASAPAVRTTLASASVYASTTHCRPPRPVFRSSAIRDSAVLTTAMSSISIAVAAQTTTSVQRWFSFMREREGSEWGGGTQDAAATRFRASGKPLG